MVKMLRTFLFAAAASTLFFGSIAAQSREEEEVDYFQKWLKEDVLYTITPEEQDVFNKLQTIEEKERFIEQFWTRRDPDPRTSYNEYKEEHYRRIQYANEHFESGIPGWKTDRGMIYIKFGEPDRLEEHPTGVYYLRPSYEGGGETSTYPFQIWEYRYLEGVGEDVEIEFVDPGLTGEYRITTNPWDKDALLLMPGGGLTDAEKMGMADRIDRIVLKTNPHGHNPLLLGYGRAKDASFAKLFTLTNLQRAPSIDFSDFRRPEVLTNIRYELLPFEVGISHFSVDEDEYVVPVTIVVPLNHLDFVAEGEVYRSALDLFGQVSAVNGRIITTFEETIGSARASGDPSEDANQSSMYQKSLRLASGRYKLDVILHDANSEKVGTRSTGIILPPVSSEDLTISSVVLADRIELLTETAEASPYGPAMVFPNLSGAFRPDQSLLLFFQLSNIQIDSASQSGYLVSVAEVLKGSERIFREQLKIDNENAVNRDRLHLVHTFDLAGLNPGDYEVVLQVQDQISEQNLERRIPFNIVPSN